MTEGEVSTIEVQRQEGESLGISVVGGCDTPLVSSSSSFELCLFFNLWTSKTRKISDKNEAPVLL